MTTLRGPGTRRPPEPARPVRAWVRSSPGTHLWLLVIAITSVVLELSSRDLGHYLLHRNSSNIHELTQHPAQSLFTSAFWIENPSSFLLYLVLFELVHAPVERWIGTVRWVAAVAGAHVAATLISQEMVLWSIRNHEVPRRMVHVVDIGVSYGLAASAGLLMYRLPGPWRWCYLVCVVAFFGVPLLTGGTYTDIGHAVSLAVGLACWPLTRGKSVAPNGRAVHSG
ncbi:MULTISPECIES: rhomboid-like protein [unclassified Streptomyces]|uniref:rhomboid-like protein n=1 Tax=unclassified Streptomyces TaxID=2593676 RepID=UPI0033DF6886